MKTGNVLVGMTAAGKPRFYISDFGLVASINDKAKLKVSERVLATPCVLLTSDAARQPGDRGVHGLGEGGRRHCQGVVQCFGRDEGRPVWSGHHHVLHVSILLRARDPR